MIPVRRPALVERSALAAAASAILFAGLGMTGPARAATGTAPATFPATATAPASAPASAPSSAPAGWTARPDPSTAKWPAVGARLTLRATDPVRADSHFIYSFRPAAQSGPFVLISNVNDDGFDNTAGGANEVFDVRTGKAVGLVHSGDRWWRLVLSPDGKYLAVRTGGGMHDGRTATIELWDVAANKQLSAIRFTGRNGHSCTAVGFAGDEVVIYDGDVYNAYAVKTGEKVRAIDTDGRCSTWEHVMSPNGKLLAVFHKERLVLADVATGKPAGSLTPPEDMHPAPGSAISATLAISPDGAVLAAEYMAMNPAQEHLARVRVYRIEDGKLLAQFIPAMDLSPPNNWKGRGPSFERLTFSADGKSLLISGAVYSTTDGKLQGLATVSPLGGKFREENAHVLAVLPGGGMVLCHDALTHDAITLDQKAERRDLGITVVPMLLSKAIPPPAGRK